MKKKKQKQKKNSDLRSSIYCVFKIAGVLLNHLLLKCQLSVLMPAPLAIGAEKQ